MEKINIAELLKDCPRGMELDCTMFDNVKFDYIKEDTSFPVKCFIENESSPVSFNKYGEFNIHNKAKCVIFPKGKTTWEGFQKPFKDGDVVATMNGIWIGIVKKPVDCAYETYITINDGPLVYNDNIFCFERLATEEEKQKLFDAIKANGYKWNAETKTLKKLIKPKFKVGDRVKSIYNNSQYDIKELTDTHYTLVEVINKFKYTESIIEDKNWELVSNKFDITTLKPFESRVLVRDVDDEKWRPGIWEFYDNDSENYPYVSIGDRSRYCIPYEGNQLLLGTTNNCDDFYKTWEK